MKPTVGRIVHYRSGPNVAPQAAIITHVWNGVSDRVNLAVFSPTAGLSCAAGVGPSADGGNGRHDFWSWPPRDDGTPPAKAVGGSGMNDLVDGLARLGGAACPFADEIERGASCPGCGSAAAGCDCE